MKAFIDRCNCLSRGTPGTGKHMSFVEGKRQVLIARAGDSFENNAEQILIAFKNLLACHKTQSAGVFIACNCTGPDELNGEVKGQARQFARQLFSAAAYPVLIPGAPHEMDGHSPTCSF